jgi:hypothetical protein
MFWILRLVILQRRIRISYLIGLSWRSKEANIEIEKAVIAKIKYHSKQKSN